MQHAQLLAGLDPVFIEHVLSRPAKRIERLDLPPGPVQGDHQMAVQSLALGVFGHQFFELGDRGGMLAERQLGANPLLEGLHAEPFKPERVEPRPLLIAKLVKRRPAPAREGVAQLGQGERGLTAGGGGATGDQLTLELDAVKLAIVESQKVTVLPGHDPRRLDVHRLAQPRHGHLQRAHRHVDRCPRPQLLDQEIGWDGAIAVEQQQRQQGSLPRPGNRDDSRLAPNDELP